MPFRWKDIFHEENDLAKAAAKRHQDGAANQKDLLALSIRQLQDQHDSLEHACAIVIGEANTAQVNLNHSLEQQAQLTAQGKAAMAAGHTEAAQAIAQQLQGVNSIVATQQAAYPKLKEEADKAKAAFAENGEMLRAKLIEAKSLEAEIDQSAMEENMNAAMASVTSATSATTPSFDEIRDRVHARSAQAEADEELQNTDPDVSAVHEQHLVNVAAADSIMADWGKPADAARTTPSGGSGTDRLNS